MAAGGCFYLRPVVRRKKGPFVGRFSSTWLLWKAPLALGNRCGADREPGATARNFLLTATAAYYIMYIIYCTSYKIHILYILYIYNYIYITISWPLQNRCLWCNCIVAVSVWGWSLPLSQYRDTTLPHQPWFMICIYILDSLLITLPRSRQRQRFCKFWKEGGGF